MENANGAFSGSAAAVNSLRLKAETANGRSGGRSVEVCGCELSFSFSYSYSFSLGDGTEAGGSENEYENENDSRAYFRGDWVSSFFMTT
jgi:hypothetical protein